MRSWELQAELEQRARYEDQVRPWLEGTVLPALSEEAERLRSLGSPAEVHDRLDGSPSRAWVALVIDENGDDEFEYRLSVDTTIGWPKLELRFRGTRLSGAGANWQPASMGASLGTNDQGLIKLDLRTRYKLVTKGSLGD